MKILDYEYPGDRKYLINSTPTHIWILKGENGDKYLIGLSDFFQKQIGELDKITLKKKDIDIDKGKTICLVQAKNYSAILKSPFNFKILEVNSKLDKKPKMINKDPYNSSWIYKIEVSSSGSMISENLVSAEDPKLKKFLEDEIKNNALIGDDCCPDFIGKSGVVRRKKKRKDKEDNDKNKEDNDKDKENENEKPKES
ncbi:MAG: Glycine cleavage system H protein [Candidatus Heimdallarchaeota archaeon LC_3]|nr:MAG: Glycine cleavage system H protein [Candidatus Heimdallarchaeota archaeon LC_3]